MNCHKLFFSIALVIMLASVNMAQSKTLVDIMKLVAENNLDWQYNQTSLDYLQTSSTKSEAGLYPSVGLNYNYVKDDGSSTYVYPSGNSTLTVDNDSTQTTSQAGALTISETLQNLLLPFYSYKKLKQSVTLKQFEFELFTEQLLLQSITTYYDILRLDKNIELLQETVKNATDQVNDIKSQYNLGAATLLELLSAEQSLNQHNVNLLNEKMMRQKQIFELNRLCGLPPLEPLMLKDTIVIDPSLEIATLKKAALANNLSLSIAKQQKILSQTEIDMIKADVFPSLTLSVGYYVNNRESNAGYVREVDQTGMEAQFALSWTLFNGGKRINAFKNIKNKKRLIALQYQQTEQLVIKELHRLFVEYETALDVLGLLKEAISTQKKHAEQSQFLFKTGQSSITELQESKINLLTAQKHYNDQLLASRVVELRLYQLSGKLFGSL